MQQRLIDLSGGLRLISAFGSLLRAFEVHVELYFTLARRGFFLAAALDAAIAMEPAKAGAGSWPAKKQMERKMLAIWRRVTEIIVSGCPPILP